VGLREKYRDFNKSLLICTTVRIIFINIYNRWIGLTDQLTQNSMILPQDLDFENLGILNDEGRGTLFIIEYIKNT
jgi:hypothetical protein